MGEELDGKSEQKEAGFENQELIALLREHVDAGVDFAEEDSEHLAAMLPDELLEHTIMALEVAGIDAMDLLMRRGIITMARNNSPELLEFQRQGEGNYTSRQADEITLEDQKRIDESGSESI